MNLARSPLLRRLLPGVVACAGLLGAAAPARGQSVWDLTPYRIQILLALGDAPELTPRLEADLAADLANRIDAWVGPGWDATVASAPPSLRHAMCFRIDELAVESLPKESLEFDKVLLLAVGPDPVGYQATAREMDVRTRTWNRTARMPAGHAAKLRDASFRAVRTAFAPLARIGAFDAETKTVGLRLRAGALPVRDKSIVWVALGDVFQPLMRRNDREGKLRAVAAVPWTFLVVDQIAQAELTCKLHSGVPAPLSARRRGRTEQLALAVIPPGKSTQLTLQSRTEPKLPLSGYDVYEQAPDAKSASLLGRSGRQGNLTIAPGAHPLRVLLVKHGGEVLARLPLVPGLQPEVVAAIPNDDLRLEAEQATVRFQEMLVDLVIRRELLLAKARAALSAGNIEQADEVIAELRRLKRREELAVNLEQQQQRLVSNDPSVQRKIDALFADTRKLLDKHLSQDPVDQISELLSQARAGAKPGS